ncbi:hypothetical protein VKA52_18470 [Halobacillus sp. HZG1]|nr:hypothetical protein [Halobacillus sp. HZG1]
MNAKERWYDSGHSHLQPGKPGLPDRLQVPWIDTGIKENEGTST